MNTIFEQYIVHPMANYEIMAAVWVDDDNTAHSIFLAMNNDSIVTELRDNPDTSVIDNYVANGFNPIPTFIDEGNFTEDKEIILRDYRKARKEADKLTKVL